MRFSILAIAVLAAFAPASANAAELTIRQAWARETPSTAKAGAVYMTIENSGERDRLIEARSEAAARTELHTHRLDASGIARMTQVEALEAPAGGAVALEPGGDHLMLMGLAAPLIEGESLALTLVFERAGEIEIEVPIVDLRASGP